MIHVDTHVVVWLYAEQLARLPSRARARLSVEELVASPMVELELTYLHEVGRVTDPAATVLDTLSHAVGLRLSTAPFPAVVRTGRPRRPCAGAKQLSNLGQREARSARSSSSMSSSSTATSRARSAAARAGSHGVAAGVPTSAFAERGAAAS